MGTRTSWVEKTLLTKKYGKKGGARGNNGTPEVQLKKVSGKKTGGDKSSDKTNRPEAAETGSSSLKQGTFTGRSRRRKGFGGEGTVSGRKSLCRRTRQACGLSKKSL